MNEKFILQLVRQVKGNPRLLRKVKIFAAVGVVSMVVLTSLVIWAGIALFNQATSLARQVDVTAQAESLRAGVEKLPVLSGVSCWNATQRLLTVETWLQRPVEDNLKALQTACLQAREPICQGEACPPSKTDSSSTEKGVVI